MRYAIDPTSKSGEVVSAEVWHRERQDELAQCLACGGPVRRRPAHGVQTLHFFHLPGSNCPTIEPSGVRYDALRSLPRDPKLAPANHAYFFRNLVGAHDRMKKVLGTIKLFDVVDMCKEATKKDVWSLKGMTVELMPYVLMTCKDGFDAVGNRLYPVYYVLQAPPSGATYWNFPSTQVRHILEVNANNPSDFTPRPMDLTPPINKSVEAIRQLLKQP
ncbi:hypothetical protein [Stenotrophomonas maltophilia]